ncbi:hypothetical protein SD427_06820 [Chryseobacterium sp. JJR-5R]|uniref:hypothetical protein n=1 Tax=Chryseobacterium sp. JJR-5R TaxID=3093923 RepID=UPI002A75832D|nr:hypothetical protein [Chryseobacterium sp. JJR-5R]WPO84037.1 hypothetical protein SD427_06820 [Chryseobacterium sp. JJR-5R]
MPQALRYSDKDTLFSPAKPHFLSKVGLCAVWQGRQYGIMGAVSCFRYSLFLFFCGGGFAAATEEKKRAQTCRSIRAREEVWVTFSAQIFRISSSPDGRNRDRFLLFQSEMVPLCRPDICLDLKTIV